MDDLSIHRMMLQACTFISNTHCLSNSQPIILIIKCTPCPHNPSILQGADPSISIIMTRHSIVNSSFPQFILVDHFDLQPFDLTTFLSFLLLTYHTASSHTPHTPHTRTHTHNAILSKADLHHWRKKIQLCPYQQGRGHARRS